MNLHQELLYTACLSNSEFFSQKEARKQPVIACLDGAVAGRNEYHSSYVGNSSTEHVPDNLWIWKYLFFLSAYCATGDVAKFISIVDILTPEIIMSSISPIRSYIKPVRDQSLKGINEDANYRRIPG